jgi:hypothetical protein
MRPFVVVSGSGRSGTSLTMQLLHACGLEVSDELTGTSGANPRGAWEDRAIFAEQARLFHMLAIRTLPRQNSWREGPLFDDVKARLDRLLHERLSKARSVWGFKDPKTCLFLPMWQDLSEARECELRFVLCVRRAENTIASLMANYGHSTEIAQSIYFNRNAHALADCPGRTLVVHYEDLLDGDAGILSQLCSFCGLPAERPDHELQSILVKICEPALNRTSGRLGIDLAAPVLELDGMLQGLRGEVPDVDRVRRQARELLAPLQHWEFILGAARKAIQDGESNVARLKEDSHVKIATVEETSAREIARIKQTSESKLKKAEESRVREIERIKQASQARLKEVEENSAREIARIEEANAASIVALKQRTTRQRAQSDQQISVLRREIKRLEIWQQTSLRKQEVVTNQGTHDEARRRLGEAVRKAFERPGVRTLRLPWKLARLYRKREQIHGEPSHGPHDEFLERLGKAVAKAFEQPGVRTFKLPWKLIRLYRKREQIHVQAGLRRWQAAGREVSERPRAALDSPPTSPGVGGSGDL